MDIELQRAIDEVSRSLVAFKDGQRVDREELKNLREYMEKIEAKIKRPGSGSDLTFGSRVEIEDARKSMNHFLRTGEFERKALIEGSDPGGGYTVPSILQPTTIEKLYDLPVLLSLVRNETLTGPGSSWLEPLRRSLLAAQRRTGSETAVVADTANANPLALLDVPLGESEASITLSSRLLDDTARDLSGMVVADMTAAFDRQLDAELFTGTGASSQGQGFLSASVPAVTTSDASRAWGSVQYVPSASATTIAPDSLLDLVYSLRSVYRSSASWIMNSVTAATISKLKSGDGNYLWRNSIAAGQPPSLLGYPVFTDENAPAVAANAFPVAFGNWRLAMLAVKRQPMRLIRDPYSSKPNVVLAGFQRQSCAPANTEAVKILKISLT